MTTFYSTPLYTSRCLYRRCGDRAIWRAGECPRPPRPLDNTDSAHAHSIRNRRSVYLWMDICPQYLVGMKTHVFQDVGTMNYCSPETVGDHEGEGNLCQKLVKQKNLFLKNIFKICQ